MSRVGDMQRKRIVHHNEWEQYFSGESHPIPEKIANYASSWAGENPSILNVNTHTHHSEWRCTSSVTAILEWPEIRNAKPKPNVSKHSGNNSGCERLPQYIEWTLMCHVFKLNALASQCIDCAHSSNADARPKSYQKDKCVWAYHSHCIHIWIGMHKIH